MFVLKHCHKANIVVKNEILQSHTFDLKQKRSIDPYAHNTF